MCLREPGIGIEKNQYLPCCWEKNEYVCQGCVALKLT